MASEEDIFSFEDSKRMIAEKVKKNNRIFYCIGGILIVAIFGLSIALANSKGGTNEGGVTTEHTKTKRASEWTSPQYSSTKSITV